MADPIRHMHVYSNACIQLHCLNRSETLARVDTKCSTVNKLDGSNCFSLIAAATQYESVVITAFHLANYVGEIQRQRNEAAHTKGNSRHIG